MDQRKLNIALTIACAFLTGLAIGFYAAAATLADQILEGLK